VSSDVTETQALTSHLLKVGETTFVNLRQPYQGMYLIDKELAIEFLFSDASSPDTGMPKWGIRERAAQGLTYWNVPRGAYSRMIVGLDQRMRIHSDARIHHLPNNYANDPDTPFAKLPVDEILTKTFWGSSRLRKGHPSHFGYLSLLEVSPQSGVCVKLACALVAAFVEKQHTWIVAFTSTLDGLITGLKNDAVEFSLQVSHILEQLIFLAVVVSVVKADEPPGVDAVELIVDEAFDIPFQPLGLLAVLLLY